MDATQALDWDVLVDDIEEETEAVEVCLEGVFRALRFCTSICYVPPT